MIRTDMKKPVLTYLKPANEIKAGDRILSNRMVVAEVDSVEEFSASTGRPCVAVVARSDGQIEAATIFLAEETVLVFE
jgi:hypothetical protein